MENILEMRHICKEFSGVKVLKNIDFSLRRGEVTALLGANGAGKSTLMKLLSGVYHKTSGDIFLEGKKIEITNPIKARELGIAIVHQELSIIPTLTMLENFFLGREITNHGILKEKEMLAEYDRISKEMEFYISPYKKAGEVSLAKQQMLEIMKIIHSDAQIIIMDEPTTSLTDEEAKGLFQTIFKLKEKQKTIVYISHRLEDIFTLSDRTIIMRNGSIAGDFKTKELSVPTISEYMSGEKYKQLEMRASHIQTNAMPVLEVNGIFTKKEVKNVSFQLQPGEVIGLAGLVGAGRSEIVRALYGADRIIKGTVKINGKEVLIKSPSDAIQKGIGFVPEDRKKEGLILKQEIYKNMTLIHLKSMKRRGLLNTKSEKEYAGLAIKNLSVKSNRITDAVEKLSGGNQQKVVISKWMSEDRSIMIFDEPTKGIDIGAKEDIFRTIEDFAAKGVGILFISSDLNEVIRVSDRILIIKDGGILTEIENKECSQEEIMKIILQGR